jgi:CRISPR system Cascade subunit CasB
MSETSPARAEREPLDVARLMRELVKLVPRVGPDNKESGDRAALAALRRGLGKAPGEAPEMFPVLYSRIPEDQLPLPRRERRIVFLVASLFALYPDAPPWPESARERWQSNLGASLRELAKQTDSNGPERRFVALLNSDEDDLPHHLRGIVDLLESAKSPVSVDWVRLFWDLRDWNDGDRTVQHSWASAFWGGQRVQEAANETESDTGGTGDTE